MVAISAGRERPSPLLPEAVGMDVSVLLAAEDVESVIGEETRASQLLDYLIWLRTS
jgi:hypothetical protein